MKMNYRKLAILILASYSLLVGYWMILGFGRRTSPNYMYNLIPFSTIKQYLKISNSNSNTWIINLVGNIGVFVPFGLLLPLSFGEGYIKVLGSFLSGLLVLETLQLLTRRGSFDVDDFLLNTLGAAIGYAIFKIARVLAGRQPGRG